MSTPGIELEGSYRNTKLASNIDYWYGGGDDKWSSLEVALATIPLGKRISLTIGVNVSGNLVEYYWPTSAVTDSDIRVKYDTSNKADTTYVDSHIASEASIRSGADNALQAHIDQESSTRATGDTNTLNTAKAYADSLLVSAFVDCGNYDASSNLFPTTGGTGPGGAIKKGNSFEISVSGSLSGVTVDPGDTIRALIDSPGQVYTGWAVSKFNTQQATESTRGTAKIADAATIATESTTEDQSIVTPKKFWIGITRLLAKATTVLGAWNFTGGLTINGTAAESQANRVTDWTTVNNSTYPTTAAVDAQMVAKVTGKDLSTNDYSNVEKTKLAGIQSGAEVNVQSDWTEGDTNSDAYIKHKPTIPSATSQLTNDSGYITASSIPSETFDHDIIVSLPSGRGIGKYLNGDTIPSTGKTAIQVLDMAAVAALAPTLALNSSTTIAFNQPAINNILTFSKVINSLGASTASAVLDWRRNNSGPFTVLDSSTTDTTFTHSITDSAYNTQPFNYRYTVVDTAGGTATVTKDITPTGYQAPTISFSVGSTTREIGNINTTITGTITRNSPNVPLTNYTVQYSANSGASWIAINSPATSISGSSASINVTHNDSSLVNSTILYYRVQVVDSYQTTTSGNIGITFLYKRGIGYSTSNSVSLATLLGFTNADLSNAKGATWSNVLTTLSQYTVLYYNAAAGDYSSITQAPATPTLGNWTKQADITGTNSYGATVTVRVYITNQPGSFTTSSTLITA